MSQSLSRRGQPSDQMNWDATAPRPQGVGPDLIDNYRHAAGYVDRILKGEKPADLPVKVPTKYETVINLKTAKTLGLTFPPAVLARAVSIEALDVRCASHSRHFGRSGRMSALPPTAVRRSKILPVGHRRSGLNQSTSKHAVVDVDQGEVVFSNPVLPTCFPWAGSHAMGAYSGRWLDDIYRRRVIAVRHQLCSLSRPTTNK